MVVSIGVGRRPAIKGGRSDVVDCGWPKGGIPMVGKEASFVGTGDPVGVGVGRGIGDGVGEGGMNRS